MRHLCYKNTLVTMSFTTFWIYLVNMITSMHFNRFPVWLLIYLIFNAYMSEQPNSNGMKHITEREILRYVIWHNLLLPKIFPNRCASCVKPKNRNPTKRTFFGRLCKLTLFSYAFLLGRRCQGYRYFSFSLKIIFRRKKTVLDIFIFYVLPL